MPWATAKLPDGTSAQGGFVLYGAPIGRDEFVRAYLAAAVSEAKAGLGRLGYMESKQHRLIMLRMSFCRKVMHIQRLVPTSEHADILRDYDDCLVAAVEDLLVGRGRFTDLAKLKVHIPAALGGIGVDSAAARADACYYSSFTSAYFRLTALDPDWVGSLHGQLIFGRSILATGRSSFYSVPFCCRQIHSDSLPIIGCFGTFLVCRSVVVLASSLRDFHQIHEGPRCARRAIKAAALGGAIKGCACTC